MKATLNMPKGLHEDLIGHLLPPNSEREEAAFLFASEEWSEQQVSFKVIEAEKIHTPEFTAHLGDYLELADETRTHLIKRAHDIGACLVEMHSHPFPLPAAFSLADRRGLKETVPHMWWRLNKRPYLAIVVAPTGFDALVWLDNPKVPQPLDSLVAGDRILRPVDNSLGGWK